MAKVVTATTTIVTAPKRNFLESLERFWMGVEAVVAADMVRGYLALGCWRLFAECELCVGSLLLSCWFGGEKCIGSKGGDLEFDLTLR
jgi:hypothetical protein